MPTTPHPLELYRLSVQHPLAEVAFIDRVWEHYHPDDADGPLLLREDFAGTCAVAAAWVRSDPDRQAMAVELDDATAAWADAQWAGCPRCDEDLHIVQADVMDIRQPATQVTVALNFSTLIYHDPDTLCAYLTHAHDALDPGGLLILDLFGCAPDRAVTRQSRTIAPEDDGPTTGEPFTYTWEQRAYDPDTRRIDCRIHFALADGTRLDDAFVYDWTLWPMHVLLGLMRRAGFKIAEAWGQNEADRADDGSPAGRFSVLHGEPAGGDWVAYLVGVRG